MNQEDLRALTDLAAYGLRIAKETPSKTQLKARFGLSEEEVKRIDHEFEMYPGEDDPKFSYQIWHGIARRIGWEPLTLALWYFQYKEKQTNNLP